MSTDDHYTNIILEDMNGKFDILMEAIGGIRDEQKLTAKQADLEEVKQDVKLIKAVLAEHSDKLQEHDKLIGLSTRAA